MVTCVEHGKRGIGRGYAQKWVAGKFYLLHRLAYCKAHGVTIESIHGKFVRHSCDNPRCVEPTHLLIGSHQDNMDDVSKRRRRPEIKLDEHAVNYIRAHCVPSSASPFSYNALGRKFGVSPGTIRDVHLNITHKFVGHNDELTLAATD